MTSDKSRVDEVDFVRCVCIMFVIVVHTVYFGDRHPFLKNLIITFVMPVFLIISGYLFRTERPWREHLRSMLWLAVPYAVMETAYVIMASVLPIREHIDVLTPMVLADKLLLNPIGPYWYLQTLIVCSVSYYAVFRLLRTNDVSQFIVLGLLLYAFSRLFLNGGFIVNALYFMAGAVMRRGSLPFVGVFRPSVLALLPLAVLAAHEGNLDKSASGGVLIVWLVVCFILFLYKYVRGSVRRVALFIGRNTLPVFLFSPVFTAAAKLYQPLLVGIDPSGTVFMAVTVAVAVGGSVGIAWLMDRLNVSRLMFGRRRIVA